MKAELLTLEQKLRKLKVLTKFKKNYLLYHRLDINRINELIETLSNIHGNVTTAFLWHKTPEGNIFWDDIGHKVREL